MWHTMKPLFLLVLVAGFAGAAEVVRSPDGKAVVTVELRDGRPYWSGAYAGRALIRDGLLVVETGPENYCGSYSAVGAEIEFAEKMPALTDEVKVTAELGKFVTVARRKGADWYVASMSDSQAQTYRYPLSFLQSGKSYRASLYSDEPGGRKALHTQLQVNAQTVFRSRWNRMAVTS